ncbi:MAG: inner membrane CreD family protein [Chitinophagaceae bacterium]|nr:inner membrane CreD family protein [Chitinophagaceae bacterium]
MFHQKYFLKKKRGIYEVAVYKTDIMLTGRFNNIPWQKLEIAADQILWNEAVLLFKVQDQLKGINEDLFVIWNDSRFVFTTQAPGQTPMEDAFLHLVPLLHRIMLQAVVRSVFIFLLMDRNSYCFQRWPGE